MKADPLGEPTNIGILDQISDSENIPKNAIDIGANSSPENNLQNSRSHNKETSHTNPSN